MTQKIHPLAPPEDQLVLHANAIRKLGERVIADIIEIGSRLTEAKMLCGHGGWLRWLDREFGWTAVTAEKWMSVYALSLKFKPDLNLDLLPLNALYLLARPSTPASVVEEVIERAEAGEKITHDEVRRVRTVQMQVTHHSGGLKSVTVHSGESKPLFKTPPTIDVTPAPEASEQPAAEPPSVTDNANRERRLHVEEAITGILKFGRAAEAGLDVIFMRERLSEKECETKFLDALEQAVDLLRWLRPKQ